MSAAYVVRRVLLFFVVVWAATTFIFFLPKLAPGRNPIVERIGMMVATGGVNSAGMQSMVDAYEAKFGLNKPLWQQYLTYLGDLSHGDFGYSLMLYPTKVVDIILVSMPWTIGLLTVSTLSNCSTVAKIQPHSGTSSIFGHRSFAGCRRSGLLKLKKSA